MAKAKAHPDQLGFAYDAPAPRTGLAELAGLERRIAGTVGTILASDPRSRAVIAAELSDVLDDTVSKEMLDAYSSPARTDHKVPMSRFFALLAVTGRLDLLDPLVREIGGGVLIGDEVKTARIGHVSQQIEKLQQELKALKASAPPIRTGGTV